MAALKELIAVYKAVRADMRERTVLKRDAGVLWKGRGKSAVLFSFRAQRWEGRAVDAATGRPVEGGRLQANRVYRVQG